MKLRGVQFGDFHTADDWHLTMNEKTITPPKPKTTYVSVPGRDGDLDFSEALTEIINYEDRKATFTFILTEGTQSDRVELINEIMGAIHGKQLNIIDTDDYPDYYMIGRITVTNVTNNAAYGVLQVEANCYPWRYAINEMEKKETVESSDGIVPVVMSNNGHRTVTPTITVSGNVTLTFGESSVALQSGQYQIPGFRMAPGVTQVSVSGNGTITFNYQEAVL